MNKRIYGLLGKEIAHSFSPSYFATKFKKEQIKGVEYRLFPLARIKDLTTLLANNSNIKGLNVTIPYKQSVIQLLDSLSPQAKAVGAVNTIQLVADKWIGHNTDVWGFEQSLQKSILFIKKEKKALVLGTGGASLAVCYVLKTMNIDYQLVSRVAKKNCISYADISPALLADYSIIINTTPLGMHPHIASCPDLPYQALDSDYLLFDLVYNPSETLFLKKGKQQGTKIKNGLEMLHLQAEKAWEIWNL